MTIFGSETRYWHQDTHSLMALRSQIVRYRRRHGFWFKGREFICRKGIARMFKPRGSSLPRRTGILGCRFGNHVYLHARLYPNGLFRISDSTRIDTYGTCRTNALKYSDNRSSFPCPQIAITPFHSWFQLPTSRLHIQVLPTS